MGNFTTGVSWLWQITHWWPNGNPNSLSYDTIVYDSVLHSNDTILKSKSIDNVLGHYQSIDLSLPNYKDTNFMNKKIFYNYKPLSDFIKQNDIDFSNDFTAHRYYNETQNVECYYLINSSKTTAYGWIHNLNHYWYNNYYYYVSPSPSYSFIFENLNGCSEPSFYTIELSEFKYNPIHDPPHEFYISFYPTHFGTTSSLPNGSIVTSTYGNGNIDIGPVIQGYLGCDSSNSDFAFMITDGSQNSRHNGNSSKIHNNTKDTAFINNVGKQIASDSLKTNFNVEIRPNPSNGVFNIYLNNRNNSNIQAEVIVYNTLGNIILQNKTVSFLSIDLSTQPKGVYLLKVIINNTSKYFKLIRS